jgi:hypothetical protein
MFLVNKMSRDDGSYNGEYTEDTNYEISSMEDMVEHYTDNNSSCMDMVEHHTDYDYDYTSMVDLKHYIDNIEYGAHNRLHQLKIGRFIGHTIDTTFGSKTDHGRSLPSAVRRVEGGGRCELGFRHLRSRLGAEASFSSNVKSNFVVILLLVMQRDLGSLHKICIITFLGLFQGWLRSRLRPLWMLQRRTRWMGRTPRCPRCRLPLLHPRRR